MNTKMDTSSSFDEIDEDEAKTTQQPAPLVSFDPTYQDQLKRQEQEERLADIMKQNPQAQNMVTIEKQPDTATKPMLVLIVGDNDGDEYKDWRYCYGTQQTYDYIRPFCGSCDLDRSLIICIEDKITEPTKAITFLVAVTEEGIIDDPGFDPMDYYTGDIED